MKALSDSVCKYDCKYNEIMEHITVTEAMRQRVADRLARETFSPARPAKKYISISIYAACLLLLLLSPVLLRQPADNQPLQPPLLTTPGITEVASRQELSELVDFQVTESFSLPFQAQETLYCAYGNILAEIKYTGDGYSACYRQAQGDNDNSGDYNAYNHTAKLCLNDTEIILKGSGDTYSLALWTDETYSYSLSISPGITQEAWRSVLTH